MILDKIAAYDQISVQCHDNPDADCIASGFGLYSWFKSLGKDVMLFYSGRSRITKPNLLEMLRLLDIPLEHIPAKGHRKGILVTADCQYGAGNVSKLTADAVAVIDHHIQELDPPPLHDIRPWLGSCATLVWSLITSAGYEPASNLATALYYGLYSDTGGFSEIRHPLDRDLRDNVAVDEHIINILKNSNLTLEDLNLASAALKDLEFDEPGRFALIQAEPCDPNILGFISDLAMQVNHVNIAVVFSENTDGIKYSVRTVIREAKASDIAQWIAGGLGSGGGHMEKAGGYISASRYHTIFPGVTAINFFTRRVKAYLNSYRTADSLESIGLTVDMMECYEKLPARIWFAPCEGNFMENSTIHVRMLEGDITVRATPCTYLMIGLAGEVYPIHRDRFNSTYREQNDGQHMQFSYSPTVLNRDTGVRVGLAGIARPCVGKTGGSVLARRLEAGLKLFTRWDDGSYVKGEPGDWLISSVSGDDLYIVTADQFSRLYKKK